MLPADERWQWIQFLGRDLTGCANGRRILIGWAGSATVAVAIVLWSLLTLDFLRIRAGGTLNSHSERIIFRRSHRCPGLHAVAVLSGPHVPEHYRLGLGP